MKLKELKAMIREAVRKSLNENQPAPAKPKTAPSTQPSTKPGQPKPAQPRRTFDPKPGANPKPKAMTEGEKEIVDKIVQRMRSKK
jgi:hypothetical protein